jgi:hypothetical protein
MSKHKVYKIFDSDGMTYIGSTSLQMSERKGHHHTDFKNLMHRKLYNHWRSIGWENMIIEVLDDNLPDKLTRRILEQKYILEIPTEKRLNTIKAQCDNYDATRSINSGVGELEKIQMKRKNRMDYYTRQKQDEEWVVKEKERNKIRMREKRKKERINQEEIKQQQEVKSNEYRCICGSIFLSKEKIRHENTKKHQQWLKSQAETKNEII